MRRSKWTVHPNYSFKNNYRANFLLDKFQFFKFITKYDTNNGTFFKKKITGAPTQSVVGPMNSTNL